MKTWQKIFLIVSALTAVILVFNIPSVKAFTTEELQTKIAELRAQIAALQAQLSELQGPQAAWCHDFNVNLKFGDSGDEIANLHTA